MTLIQHWINGSTTSGASTRRGEVYNPATGEQAAEVAFAERSDVDTAVTVAARAFDSWRDTSLSRRTAILFAMRELLVRHEDDLARLIVSEHGKMVEDARGEIVRGREVVEYACGITEAQKGSFSDQVSTGVDVHSFRQPLGVCAGITPFNFPIMVPLWMHPVAIATGNTFVLKPSERDPSVSNRVAELYAEAGLPDGVFNVVHGDKVAVDSILEHPEVAAVSFVGSTAVAKYVHERATVSRKRVQALGGAKNHAVVLPDAHLESVADHLVGAAFGSAGQRCMAVSVGVAVGSVGDALVDLVAKRASELTVGPASDPASDMGPVVSRAAQERVTNALALAADQGADIVLDGRALEIPGHESGFFVGPSVVDRVTPDMDVYRQEIFGPVLAVSRVNDLDEAIELINSNPYGNGTALFTGSGESARRFSREVNVGMVGINVPIPVPISYYSFGGWKDSLIGDSPVHGPEGSSFYTRPKVISSRWEGSTRSSPHTPMNFPTSS